MDDYFKVKEVWFYFIKITKKNGCLF